jgi:hypothetical protein
VFAKACKKLGLKRIFTKQKPTAMPSASSRPLREWAYATLKRSRRTPSDPAPCAGAAYCIDSALGSDPCQHNDGELPGLIQPWTGMRAQAP